MNIKNNLRWFDIKNYKKCNELTPQQWAEEINNRIFLRYFLIINPNTLKNDYFIRSAKLLENIKKHGLIFDLVGNEKFITHTQKEKSNGFVKNLSALDGFGFLYYSDRKESFMEDAEKMNLHSSQTTADINLRLEILEKYSLPMSTEVIESLNRENILHNRPPEIDIGDRFLEFDLNASDEVIIADFKKWLEIERKGYAPNYPPKSFSNSEIQSWCKHQLLAYWDIKTVCEFEKINIKNHEIGSILFPDEPDVDTSERVRKVIKPKVDEVFTEETCNILSLMNQTE